MRFHLPPLTNMSDTDSSTRERVETMYTVEVVLRMERASDETGGDGLAWGIASNKGGIDERDRVGQIKMVIDA